MNLFNTYLNSFNELKTTKKKHAKIMNSFLQSLQEYQNLVQFAESAFVDPKERFSIQNSQFYSTLSFWHHKIESNVLKKNIFQDMNGGHIIYIKDDIQEAMFFLNETNTILNKKNSVSVITQTLTTHTGRRKNKTIQKQISYLAENSSYVVKYDYSHETKTKTFTSSQYSEIFEQDGFLISKEQRRSFVDGGVISEPTMLQKSKLVIKNDNIEITLRRDFSKKEDLTDLMLDYYEDTISNKNKDTQYLYLRRIIDNSVASLYNSKHILKDINTFDLIVQTDESNLNLLCLKKTSPEQNIKQEVKNINSPEYFDFLLMTQDFSCSHKIKEFFYHLCNQYPNIDSMFDEASNKDTLDIKSCLETLKMIYSSYEKNNTLKIEHKTC